MKRILLALALLALPSVSSAAPQVVQITYSAPFHGWAVLGSVPPIILQDGTSLSTGGLVFPTVKRVADALGTLPRIDGKVYSCKASAFAGPVVDGNPLIEMSSLNAKSCVLLN